MPLNPLNFNQLLHEPNNTGLSNLFKNYYEGMEMSQTPQKMAQERLQGELQNRILGSQAEFAQPMAQANLQKQQQENQYYGRSKEAEIAYKQAAASGKTFAPSALGQLVKERDAIAKRNPEDPLLAEYDRVIKSTGGGKQFAPTGLGKLYGERQEIEEGFRPGTNRTEQLSPEEQQESLNRYDLAIQKTTTDSGLRKSVLQGNNLLKSINASNIDDLTRYSGLSGAAKLKKEQGKDLFGQGSEDYLKYLEAKQAVALEAKELRQFFGDSITNTAADALYDMVNATALTKSPEAAKRMIQKSRDTIKKQVDTFSKALKSSDPYSYDSRVDELSGQLQDGIGMNKDKSYADMTPEELIEAYNNG